MAENCAPFGWESNGVSNNADQGWPAPFDSESANGLSYNADQGWLVPNPDQGWLVPFDSDSVWSKFIYAKAMKEAEGDDYDEEDVDRAAKKVKQKKPKKPKIPKMTVAEAAAKIDASDLKAFLGDLSDVLEEEENIQMMRFADYFRLAFDSVTAYKFPWVKMFWTESLLKTVEVSLKFFVLVNLCLKNI
ncbi:hypothetical protein A2U01_0027240 [Trifolium medium]|uniref:Uncharacterized protein n=1 Tax=Trifolium medium TaxID=97028 RepID=A0A392P2A2_9FABA|nr:hypothetical protein [Trifolium medium]